MPPKPKAIADFPSMTISKSRQTAAAAWAKLARLWREIPIETPESLQEFVSARASLVAQKAAVDYCRGKTGVFSHALFEEKDFQDALTVCRWETFAATVADILLIAEGILRAHAGTQDGGEAARRVVDALARLYPEILASYPLPAHRADKGWSDAEAAFALRFAAAAAAPPRAPADIAEHSARRLFETLPIHTNMREFDQEIVHGAVRFRMVAVHQELHRRARPAELVAALAERGTGA